MGRYYDDQDTGKINVRLPFGQAGGPPGAPAVVRFSPPGLVGDRLETISVRGLAASVLAGKIHDPGGPRGQLGAHRAMPRIPLQVAVEFV